jgi:hypothetical protein
MVLVTVRDSDPHVEMKGSEIDPKTLHQQRGSLVKKVMDSVQEHYPNFDERLYRCLQSPDEWLNDHVIVQFVKHLQHGIPPTKRAHIQVLTQREIRPRSHKVRYSSTDEEGGLSDTDIPDEMQGYLCVSVDPRRSGSVEGGENFILTTEELRLSLQAQ